MPKKYASDGQVDYIIKLRRWEIESIAQSMKDIAAAAEKRPTPKELNDSLEPLRKAWRAIPKKIQDEGLTQDQASKEISRIKQLRESNHRIARQKRSEENLRHDANIPELADGVYRNAANGKIYKVKRAVHGSGRKVAHELVITEEVIMVDTSTEFEHDQAKVKTFVGEFVYAGLATRFVKAEEKMTLEEAKKFGALYGVCCQCGRTLTKQESIDAGIGPICAGKDIW